MNMAIQVRMLITRKRSGSSSPFGGPILGQEKRTSGTAATEEGIGQVATAHDDGNTSSPASTHGPFAAVANPFAPSQQPQPTLPPLQQQFQLLDQVAASSYINAVQQHQILLSQHYSQQHLQHQQSQAASLGLQNLFLYDHYLNYASKFL